MSKLRFPQSKGTRVPTHANNKYMSLNGANKRFSIDLQINTFTLIQIHIVINR
jgi:hypothetical protein